MLKRSEAEKRYEQTHSLKHGYIYLRQFRYRFLVHVCLEKIAEDGRVHDHHKDRIDVEVIRKVFPFGQADEEHPPQQHRLQE